MTAVVLIFAARDVFGRLLDRVDPDLVDSAVTVLAARPGVRAVRRVRMRWVGHQLEAAQRVAAVAAADDHGAVGVGHLHAQRAVHVPGHRPELPGLAEVLAVIQFDVIAEPGQMRAGIGQQDAVRG